MPSPIHRAVAHIAAAPPRFVALITIAAMVVMACGSAAIPPRTITFQTMNDSGVTGTVSFTDVSGKTRVEVTVDAGDNPDMPAHIHPGACGNITPQPKFPLENARSGSSKTVVPASIDDLFAGNLAVNLHKSNNDFKTHTACVDIR